VRKGRPRPVGDQPGRVFVAGGVAGVHHRVLPSPPQCCPAASCSSVSQRAAWSHPESARLSSDGDCWFRSLCLCREWRERGSWSSARSRTAVVRDVRRRRGLLRIGRLRRQHRATARDFTALGIKTLRGGNVPELELWRFSADGHHEPGEPDGCQVRRRGCRHARHGLRSDDLLAHCRRVARTPS
jgi:hypothetical protein